MKLVPEALPGVGTQLAEASGAFQFLSANTPWVYALAEALAERCPTQSVCLYDWLTYWRLKPAWPKTQFDTHLKKTMRVLPPGYAGSLEFLARPFMSAMIRRWCDQLARSVGEPPWVVVPYPYLAPWVRGVPDDRLIYYNLDEYTFYRPSRAEQIRAQEDEIINRAARVICLSRYQVNALRERHPEQAGKIIHFPLGVHESFINPTPGRPPEPNTVGYIGNLIDRVDWRFVSRVARECPELTFVFVGAVDDMDSSNDPAWRRAREEALSLRNVRHIGRVKQEKVVRYYWSFAVNWIPYDTEHPFNVASCPTKIMDGIASGRPVLSTAVPECELYPQWISVAKSADAAADMLRGVFTRTNEYHAEEAVAFARRHTWSCRAQELLSLVAKS